MVARSAQDRSDPEQAARLLGTAERMREDLGARLDGIELELHEHTLKALTTNISPADLVAAWNAGRREPLEVTLAGIARDAPA